MFFPSSTRQMQVNMDASALPADEHAPSTLTIFLLACVTYYTMAVLVQLHGTTMIRLALLPVVLWMTWLTTYLNIWKTLDNTRMHINYAIAVSHDKLA